MQFSKKTADDKGFPALASSAPVQPDQRQSQAQPASLPETIRVFDERSREEWERREDEEWAKVAEISRQTDREFWFVGHIGFEEKESRSNRLILNLRKWSQGKPRSFTFYLNHRVSIPTDTFRKLDYALGVLDRLEKDQELSEFRPVVYIPEKERERRAELEQRYPDAEFVVEDRSDCVINISVPCDRRVLDRLESKGFQIGNRDKQIRRQLKWMHHEVEIDKRLEEVADVIGEVEDLQRRLSHLVSEARPVDFSKQSSFSARTRLANELASFFSSSRSDRGEIDADIPRLQENGTREKHPSLSRLQRESPVLFGQLAAVYAEINKNVSFARRVAKSIDPANKVGYNPETRSYEVLLDCPLSADPKLLFGARPAATAPKGLTIKKEILSYECWNRLCTAIVDIEKPMWKTEEQREMLARRDELMMRLSDPSCPDDIDAIKEELVSVMSGLVHRSADTGEETDIGEDVYREQISRIQLMIIREDGSESRMYFKLRLPMQPKRELKREIGGFVTFYFEDERSLISSFIEVWKTENPYRAVGHVIPYDGKEIREGAKEQKAGRMDSVIAGRDPRLWRRGFYQKITLPGLVTIDTHRRGSDWFPYLKSKEFGMSHRLVDVSNWVWRQKRRLDIPTVMNEEFRKIATHEQLKDLAIREINGDLSAEDTLDDYSTRDIDPVLEILTFEPIMRTLYEVSVMMPHAPTTDIAFSSTSISELSHAYEWDKRHTQLHYGYEEKKREDERQIFKRRLAAYMRRQLSDEGIPQLSSATAGAYTGVYMTYVPLELWMRESFFPNTPGWARYFNLLSDDDITRFGQLQPAKYFMRKGPGIHIDYYLYRREMDIVRQCARKSGLSGPEMVEAFRAYFSAVSAADGSAEDDRKSLIRRYRAAYTSLKDGFRTFYVSFKVRGENSEDAAMREKAKQVRKRIKQHLLSPGGRREDTQMTLAFVPLFDDENADIIGMRKLPNEYSEALEDKSSGVLMKFRKDFDRLVRTVDEIRSILSREENLRVTERVSAENLIFMFMQNSIANYRSRVFRAVYHIEPEGPGSFGEMLDAAYKSLGDWTRARDLHVIGAKGDYLFLRRKDGGRMDFTGAPVMPLRRFEKLDLGGDVESDDAADEEFKDRML